MGLGGISLANFPPADRYALKQYLLDRARSSLHEAIAGNPDAIALTEPLFMAVCEFADRETFPAIYKEARSGMKQASALQWHYEQMHGERAVPLELLRRAAVFYLKAIVGDDIAIALTPSLYRQALMAVKEEQIDLSYEAQTGLDWALDLQRRHRQQR